MGPWSIDVAYFMVGSLSIVDRQHHEDALLRHHLHGVMWAFCPPQMQDPDARAEMPRRHVQAAADHETLAILEADAAR